MLPGRRFICLQKNNWILWSSCCKIGGSCRSSSVMGKAPDFTFYHFPDFGRVMSQIGRLRLDSQQRGTRPRRGSSSRCTMFKDFRPKGMFKSPRPARQTPLVWKDSACYCSAVATHIPVKHRTRESQNPSWRHLNDHLVQPFLGKPGSSQEGPTKSFPGQGKGRNLVLKTAGGATPSLVSIS